MSRVSGLRMPNVSDLMCLPKSRETKAVKQRRKGQARSQIPGFQHDSGDGLEVDNTLSATRLN